MAEIKSEYITALVNHNWMDCYGWDWARAMQKRNPRVISRKEAEETLARFRRRYQLFYKDGKILSSHYYHDFPLDRAYLLRHGWIEL